MTEMVFIFFMMLMWMLAWSLTGIEQPVVGWNFTKQEFYYEASTTRYMTVELWVRETAHSINVSGLSDAEVVVAVHEWLDGVVGEDQPYCTFQVMQVGGVKDVVSHYVELVYIAFDNYDAEGWYRGNHDD